MSSPVSSCEPSIQNGEYQQVPPFQESFVPSSTSLSVNKVFEETLLHPAAIPPSDGSCLILALTEGVNQPHLGHIMFYLGKENRGCLAATCRAFLQVELKVQYEELKVRQKELNALLISFGIAYSCTEENEKQTLSRITTILDSF